MKYLIIILLVLISGCQSVSEQSVSDICVQACKDATKNLEDGPCLLDPIESSDYVCDVAHNPREEIDNQAEKQCRAYPDRARHFIEVTPNCEIIRVV